MNYRERKTFVSELISRVRRDIIAELPGVPVGWDGHELRKLIAERFAENDCSRLLTGKRLRDYHNQKPMQFQFTGRRREP